MTASEENKYPGHPTQFNTWLPPELKHDLKVIAAETDRPLYAVTAAAIYVGLRYMKGDLMETGNRTRLMKHINRFLTQGALAADEAEPREDQDAS